MWILVRVPSLQRLSGLEAPIVTKIEGFVFCWNSQISRSCMILKTVPLNVPCRGHIPPLYISPLSANWSIKLYLKCWHRIKQKRINLQSLLRNIYLLFKWCWFGFAVIIRWQRNPTPFNQSTFPPRPLLKSFLGFWRLLREDKSNLYISFHFLSFENDMDFRDARQFKPFSYLNKFRYSYLIPKSPEAILLGCQEVILFK